MTARVRPPRTAPAITITRALGVTRLVMAAVCIVALIARFIWGLGSVTFEPGNFFAYLTIQSNIMFAVVAIVSGISAVRGRIASPRLDALRAAVLTCTITAGLVFAVIVQQSSIRAIRVDVPWSDVVLHYILPAVALVEWALSRRRRHSPWRVLPVVLGYTCGWGAVTMIRGAITGWYPYYFLDPDQTRDIGEFLLFSGAALAVFAVVGALVIGVSAVSAARQRVRGRREG
jgi:hypothetical protein